LPFPAALNRFRFLARDNPSIANVIFRAGEIETWGRGIQRILEACRDANTPEPIFTCESGALLLTFPFAVAYIYALHGNENTARKTQPVDHGTREKSSDKILRLLAKDGQLTIGELAGKLEITTRGVDKNLRKLQDSGKLRRIGPAKGGHWKVLK
jgi:ATP-dependent DNA helicase RecG